MNNCIKTGLAIAAFIVAGHAQAQSATASTVMPVTASVTSSCIVVAQPLAFGTLSLAGGNNDSQTTITLTCTPGITYNLGLDAGTHAQGGVRRMAGTLNGSTIPYYIYSNAGRTTEWGNTIGTNTVSGTVSTPITNLTVYGRVAANASLFAAGGYTDAVTVTVTF